jgi:hypothetical protein
MWAAFWAAPEMSSGADILADDIVGYWPGETEPVRGLAEYQAKIAELLAAYPDLRLELIDSATVAGKADGEGWSICITSAGRPGRGAVQIRGLDRVRSRNGIVVENVIRYDPARLPGR